MMSTQIKQQWVTALRSGEYTQASSNLRTEEGYCCLGVLCDLYSKDTRDISTEWEVNHTADARPIPFYNFMNEGSFLPIAVVNWAGLDKASPVIDLEGVKMELAQVNDSGSTFTQIAQLIEEQL
jgi:hypothetical protein